MENQPDKGSLDPHAQEAQRILDTLRDLRGENIDREVAEDEIQLRKEKGLRQTGKRN